jgi:hypothetical protein
MAVALTVVALMAVDARLPAMVAADILLLAADLMVADLHMAEVHPTEDHPTVVDLTAVAAGTDGSSDFALDILPA